MLFFVIHLITLFDRACSSLSETSTYTSPEEDRTYTHAAHHREYRTQGTANSYTNDSSIGQLLLFFDNSRLDFWYNFNWWHISCWVTTSVVVDDAKLSDICGFDAPKAQELRRFIKLECLFQVGGSGCPCCRILKQFCQNVNLRHSIINTVIQ
jgi:hypothetical protein